MTALTGLTPEQFLDGASTAVSQAPGFFYWGQAGNLSIGFLGVPSYRPPIAVDSKFRTPYSQSLHVGVQRELTKNLAAYGDYFYRTIRNILGVRLTNLAFEARMPGLAGKIEPGTGDQPTSTYGPWYSGNYHALIVGLRKQMTGRFMFEGSYTYTHATDNLLSPSLNSNVQTGLGVRLTAFGSTTDSFVGVPSVVTDPVNGQTNANSSFIASNGNPVPQAGRFYYGPNLDRGPSDLSCTHTFSAYGFYQLPKGFQISAIFARRADSSTVERSPLMRQTWMATEFQRRLTSRLAETISSRRLSSTWTRAYRSGSAWRPLRLEALIEYFNVFNRANPSQIQTAADAPVRFGTVTQVLPGREGQVGIKLVF